MPLDKNRQYVIGTAGHIDHGKTALVKALTGVDTDRLPEEKERGITIDLGFAHLSENITIIDVPGHERLIKNMVAGVSTIDLVLFTIAADDGVMPQTREHLDIVNLLQISHGIFAITKADLVDTEWLELVEEEVGNLLRGTRFEGAPIVRTSSLTGMGIEQLRRLLLDTLEKIPPKQDLETFRQPVDRVFTVKGFGTVVTGTVLSGRIKSGDSVEIQPTQQLARVRGIQSHQKPVKEVRSGDRAAINLAGVDAGEITRGDVLVTPSVYQPVLLLNARLTVLKSSPLRLKNNQRVRFHIHTTEAFARLIIPDRKELAPGESAFVQLRLEQPVHAAYQDRFIIRQYSPQRTLGGGVVLQTNPEKFRRRYYSVFRECLSHLEKEQPEKRILASFDTIRPHALSETQIRVATNISSQKLGPLLNRLTADGQLTAENIAGEKRYYSRSQMHQILAHLEKFLLRYHTKFPGRSGISEAEIISQMGKFYTPGIIQKALDTGINRGSVVRQGKWLRLRSFEPRLSEQEKDLQQKIESRFLSAGFKSPTIKELQEEMLLSSKELKEILNHLSRERTIIYIDDNLIYHRQVFSALLEKLRQFFSKKARLAVSDLKDLIGTTRKHAIPLLEYLDQQGYTERDGNVRKAGPNLNRS